MVTFPGRVPPAIPSPMTMYVPGGPCWTPSKQLASFEATRGKRSIESSTSSPTKNIQTSKHEELTNEKRGIKQWDRWLIQQMWDNRNTMEEFKTRGGSKLNHSSFYNSWKLNMARNPKVEHHRMQSPCVLCIHDAKKNSSHLHSFFDCPKHQLQA